MKLASKRTFAALSVVAVSAVGLGSSASAATRDHTIHKSDLDAVRTATDGGARADLLSQGLHVAVPNADSAYAIGVFDTAIDLADVHSVTSDWIGTENRPGVKLNVDVSGDGTVDCQLVSEKVYGTTDVWLNKDAEDFKDVDGEKDSNEPDGYCAKNAPDSGSTGYDHDGSLADWAAALSNSGAQTPVVAQVGYGASGLVQDGVLESITVGDESYSFSDQTPVDVVGQVDSSKSNGAYAVVNLSSAAAPAGASEGAKVTWQISTGPRNAAPADLTPRLQDTMGAGESLKWTYSFTPGERTQKVYVTKDGMLAQQFVVRP